MEAFFVVALTTLLTTINPVESLGPFLGLTLQQDRASKLATARKATLVSSAILLVASLCGTLIFHLFGISLPAFRIAGGILLFSVGVGMLNPPAEDKPLERGHDIAIFPLAIPIIAGPGAIASVLILSERAKGIEQVIALYSALILTQGIVYLVMNKAEWISRLVGPVVLEVMNKLMGLILAALAAQFVIDGLKEAFPGLN